MSKKEKFKQLIIYIVLFLVLLLLFSVIWGKANFQIKSFNQVLYTLITPMSGASDGVTISWIVFSLMPSFLIAFACAWICLRKQSRLGIFLHQHIHKLTAIICIVVLCISLIAYDVPIFAMNKIMTSTLYDDHYVDPSKQDFTFPNKKKNLIYIYLESMETTFASSDMISVEGGSREKGYGYSRINYIPELSELAMNNISFSNTDGLGGAFLASDTTWTTAGMLAQTSGVSLNPSIVDDGEDIAPGAYSLGEVLETAGYNQTLMFGSKSEFGGRDKYFLNHGNYKIFDLDSAKDLGYLPEDYHTWWGYEDSKLFEYAKIELQDLASKDAPFNLTMLTVNTHNPEGYLEESCDAKYDNQLLDSVACSSKQVGEFVEWISEQEWYSDTVIIMSGDHLSMNTSYMSEVDANAYDRRIYNSFINVDIDKELLKLKNREFSALDMYPTTLAALGVKWEGERLGLGTNLFSKWETLPEEMGQDEFNKELALRSIYYNNSIVRRKFRNHEVKE